MERPRIKRVRNLTLIGRPGFRGTYLLRIQLTQSADIAFGGFNRGNTINVPKGDYLYVGSALGLTGAVSLPGRLVRHATRVVGPAHAIRDSMIEQFKNLRLCGPLDEAPDNKRPHWHVDYMLTCAEAQLCGAFVIFSKLKLERPLAKMLANDDGVAVIKKGLGASDNAGATHLLRVKGGDEWWKALPARLAHLFLLEQLRSIYRTKLDALPQPPKLSSNQIVYLGNMDPVRARETLRRMAEGESFTAADKWCIRNGIFDTRDWGEVASRLRRGRGAVLIAEAAIKRMERRWLRDSDRQQELIELIQELMTAAKDLSKLVHNEARKVRVPLPTDATADPAKKKDAFSYEKARGNIRTTLTYIEKCVRDIPRLNKHSLDPVVPTVNELLSVHNDATVILHSCGSLLEFLQQITQAKA